MKLINGIEEIINKYEVYLLDQWGVMHNGSKGFLKAIECVNYLKKKNKKLIIISNSSKRKINSIKKLPSLGFYNDFDEVITSGEIIWKTLFNSINSYGNNLKKCFHIFDHSNDEELEYRFGLQNIDFVESVIEADFILACTPIKNWQPLDYIPILKKAHEKKLIMFCANPDFETVLPDNKNNIYCIGTVAQLYSDMGGKVIIKGKPDLAIYSEATNFLKNLNKSKIIAVGDSIFHDIKGAENFKIDSLLITSGIHRNFFDNNQPDWKNKKNKLLNYKIVPTYICAEFQI